MTEMKATRDGYGEALVELGAENADIVVLDADLAESTRTSKFRDAYPERFFNMGIAEQNLMNTAAGLAACGKVAFASTFAIFASGRAWEQIRNTIAAARLNVKIVSSHGGVCVGPDGMSHQCVEDISLMRTIPNMRVIVPCDYWEARKAVVAVASEEGPFYVRMGRQKSPVITGPGDEFVVGRAAVLREGRDLSIIACGLMVAHALQAADRLGEEGVSARVVNMHTIKPIDGKTVAEAARETGALVTAEEHSVIGGLGSAVSEVVVRECPVPVEMVGVCDLFGQSGTPDELLREYGLQADDIAAAARRSLERKQAR